MNYADPIDQAADAAQQRLDDAIQATLRAGTTPALPAIGECHYCGDFVPEGHRFCDAHCREDYDYLQSRRKANA